MTELDNLDLEYTARCAQTLQAILIDRGQDDEDQIRLEVNSPQIGRVALFDYFTPMQSTYHDASEALSLEEIGCTRSIPEAHRIFYAAGYQAALSLIIESAHHEFTVFIPANVSDEGFAGFLVRDLPPEIKALDRWIISDNENRVITSPADTRVLTEALDALGSEPAIKLHQDKNDDGVYELLE